MNCLSKAQELCKTAGHCLSVSILHSRLCVATHRENLKLPDCSKGCCLALGCWGYVLCHSMSAAAPTLISSHVIVHARLGMPLVRFPLSAVCDVQCAPAACAGCPLSRSSAGHPLQCQCSQQHQNQTHRPPLGQSALLAWAALRPATHCRAQPCHRLRIVSTAWTLTTAITAGRTLGS